MNFQLDLQKEGVHHAHPFDPEMISRDTTVRDVLHLLRDRNTGSVLIENDGSLVGIFTERDALNVLAQGGNLNAPISSVMSQQPATIDDASSVASAIIRMAKGGYRRLPLVNDSGEPVGVVKVSGILRYLVEHFPQTIYNLPPVPDAVAQTREGA